MTPEQIQTALDNFAKDATLFAEKRAKAVAVINEYNAHLKRTADHLKAFAEAYKNGDPLPTTQTPSRAEIEKMYEDFQKAMGILIDDEEPLKLIKREYIKAYEIAKESE